MKVRFMAAIAGLALLASVAHATGGNSKVVSISVTSGLNYATVQFIGSAGTRPACHAGGVDSYGFDISTNKGKALFSLLQGAMLAGKTVGFGGSSTCTTVCADPWCVIETLDIATVYTK